MDPIRSSVVSAQTVATASGLLSSSNMVVFLDGLGGTVATFVVTVIVLIWIWIKLKFQMDAAMNQVEMACRIEYPELWRVFEAKLESGESMNDRPDLVLELAKRLQQRGIEWIITKDGNYSYARKERINNYKNNNTQKKENKSNNEKSQSSSSVKKSTNKKK